MSIDHLIEKAKTLLSKGKLDDAKKVFENILKVEPDHYKKPQELSFQGFRFLI